MQADLVWNISQNKLSQEELLTAINVFSPLAKYSLSESESMNNNHKQWIPSNGM